MVENNELMRTLISRVPLPLSLASAAVSASSSPRSGPERRSMEAPAPVLPVMNLMLTQHLKIAARQILVSRCANRFRGGRREPSTVASYVQGEALGVVKMAHLGSLLPAIPKLKGHFFKTPEAEQDGAADFDA